MAYDGSVKFDTKIDSAGFQRDLGKMKSAAKTAFTAIGAAAAGAVVASAKIGIGFESAFAGVKKTVNATDDQLAKLRDGIRDMAKEIPSSANEIAGIAEAAGQLGIKTDSILSFTRVMSDLGVATNLAGDEAASTLAKFANITGMPQENFDRLGSTIVALGNNLATTEADIAAMAMRLAGAGTQVGMTEAQILSFAGALSSVGIEAEAGGSAFSRVMSDMQLAVETNSKDLKKYAKVAGMTGDQFKKSFQKDAAGAILEFVKGLNNTARNGKSATAVLADMGIEEIRLSDALKRAAGASGVFEDAVKLGNEAWEENTALTKEAEQRYATTESKIKILGNSVKDLGITAWDTMSGPFNGALDAAGEKVSELSSSMINGELKGAVENIGVFAGDILNGVVNLAAGAIPVVSDVISGITNMSGLLIPAAAGFAGYKTAVGLATAATKLLPAALTALTNPVGAAGLGIGVLAGLFIKARKSSEEWYESQWQLGDALDEASQKFDAAKSKAELTDDYAQKWRDLNTAINDGSLSGEALKDAEGKRKEYEEWFIENWPNYVNAEEEKNGIRETSIDKIQEMADVLSDSARLEAELAALQLKEKIPDYTETIEQKKKVNAALQTENDTMLDQNITLQKVKNQWADWNEESHTKQENAEHEAKLMDGLSYIYGKHFDCMEDVNRELESNTHKIEDNNTKIGDNQKTIDDATGSLQSYANYCQQLINTDLGSSLEEFSAGYDLVKKAMAEIDEQGSLSDETITALKDRFPELAEEISNSETAPDALKEKFQEMDGKLQTAKDTAEEFGVKLNGLPKEVSVDVKLNVPNIPSVLQPQDFVGPIKRNYARGTLGAPGGPAVVNDGNGPELIEGKDGSFKMVQSKGAALTWLDRGDRVYTAEQTRSLMRRVPHYAKGIGNGGAYSGTVEITSFVDKVPEAFDKAMDELELRRDLDVIDEEQYYAELDALKDKYFAKGSDKWWEYEKEIYNHRKETAEKAAEEAAEAELDEIERRHDLGLLSEQAYIDELTAFRDKYYAEGTEEFVEMTDKINDINRQNELDMMQYGLDIGLLTKRQYYDKLTEYRDKYFAVGSKDWLEYTKEIYQYYVDGIKAAYDELAEYAKEQLADIEAKQETLTQKLADDASFYRTVTIKNAYEDGSDMVFKELKDWTPDIEKVKRYNDAITAAKERILGSGIEPEYAKIFIDKLMEESVEDGTELAELLVSASDEELKKHLDGFAEYQKLSKDTAASQYEAETEDAKKAIDAIEKECEVTINAVKELFFGSFTEALEEAGLVVPDGFFDVGEKSAEEFENGFSGSIEEAYQKIKERFNFDVVGGLAVVGDGATTAYSTFAPVYNFNVAGETTVQMIQAAEAASERNKLSGGY